MPGNLNGFTRFSAWYWQPVQQACVRVESVHRKLNLERILFISLQPQTLNSNLEAADYFLLHGSVLQERGEMLPDLVSLLSK
jgi:hypothetical protein